MIRYMISLLGLSLDVEIWPTDEPYSVIASNELGLCETMLGKEFPSTLMSINNLAAVLRDQGKYDLAEEMYRQELRAVYIQF